MNAMIFRTLFVVAFLAVASGQGCIVCGDGKIVSAPTAIFSFPGYTPISCGELQTAGQKGEIEASNCGVFSVFVAACVCVPGTLPPIGSPGTPTDPPNDVGTPTDPPVDAGTPTDPPIDAGTPTDPPIVAITPTVRPVVATTPTATPTAPPTTKAPTLSGTTVVVGKRMMMMKKKKPKIAKKEKLVKTGSN